MMKNLDNRELLLHADHLARTVLHHDQDCDCESCKELRVIQKEMQVIESKDLKDKLIGLMNQGWTRSEAAENLGVTAHDAVAALRGDSISTVENQPHPQTIQRRKRVAQYYRDGLTIKQIAEIEKRTTMTIMNDLRCMEIDVTKREAS